MSLDSGLNEYFERTETDGELLPVVDAEDRVVGLETRREIHRQSLLHRAVHVILHDGEGRFLLQKRSERKDHLPGWWDVSVGGHVGPEESYLEAAVREIGEEMGIVGAEPTWIGRQEPSAESGWEFIHVFVFETRGPVMPDEAEISAIHWVTAPEYESLLARKGADWRMSSAGERSLRMFLTKGGRDSS